MTRPTDKKQAILEAASEVFARYGYAKATLDDVGKEVGLNKASLYYYFPNKESLFAEVLQAEARECLPLWQEADLAAPTALEQAVAYLQARIRSHAEVIEFHRLSPDALHGFKTRFHSLFHEVEAEEAAWLQA